MGCHFFHSQPCADKGGQMTATWIFYVIIGLAASAYGFYLTRKQS